MKPLYCLIPARGGSKRFPRKNIALLNGKPLITYPIHAAKESGLFADVVVSTEDAEISAIARDVRATVIPRPISLAGDQVGVVEVTLHFLDSLQSRGVECESIAVIYPTAALVTPKDICAGWDQYQKENANSLMVITDYSEQPLWALREVNGFYKPAFPKCHTPRQRLPTYWVDKGYFYFIRTKCLRKYRSFHVPRTAGYRTDRLRAIDINQPEDLKLVEAVLAMTAAICP